MLRPALVAVAVLLGGVSSAFADTPQTLTTDFAYTATVPPPAAHAKALDLWLPIPSSSVWQTVSHVSVSAPAPYKITQETAYGNRMIYLHETDVNGPLEVTVHFTVQRRSVQGLDSGSNAPQDSSLQSVMSPDNRVPVGGRFQTIADEVTKGYSAHLDRERALFNHVVSTMQYDYHHASPKYAQGDAAFVCDYKSGNCSDLHSYLIALFRSSGVPAELEFGFPLSGVPVADPLPADGTITGYHCWVWFRDAERGWIPLDAADARRWTDAGHADVARSLFGSLVPARSAVAVSHGRDITLSPPQKAGPLNYFIYPYAEADGQPVEAKWKLTYHQDPEKP